MNRALAFSGANDEGDSFELFLVQGKPVGHLEIRLANGYCWMTEIGLDEIALFAAHRVDLTEVYLTEMLLNARANCRYRLTGYRADMH